MPEWITTLLKDMGVAGGIIFVLMTVVTIMSEVIRRLIQHASKVYGYRLTERDTLNKALTDTAKVLADMLEATKDRNDLTEDQADLIAKQSQAFEILKLTILGQYDNIKNNNTAVAQSVTAMAEAIRALTSLVNDNRHVVTNQVTEVKQAISGATAEIKEAIRVANQAQIVEIRNVLGADVTLVRRRQKSP
jgi:hypothetical protein